MTWSTSARGRSNRRPARAATGAESWRLRAACLGMDLALFFHPEGEQRRSSRKAIAVCRKCPVIAACREWALTTREPYGVLGGLTEAERKEIHAREVSA